jgi:hypothetical protein
MVMKKDQALFGSSVIQMPYLDREYMADRNLYFTILQVMKSLPQYLAQRPLQNTNQFLVKKPIDCKRSSRNRIAEINLAIST